MKEGSKSGASLCKVIWRDGSFTGDPERYVKEIYQERCKNTL
jgi:hypothetical protein